MFAARMLGVLLALCTVLSLSRGGPLNTSVAMKGPCQYKRMYCPYYPDEYCPECDEHGYFVPWQCSHGYCYCVNVKTGEEIPYTKRPEGSDPLNCEHGHYCPDGWTYYDEQCYKYIDSEKTWIEAEFYCLFEGGNLASIHSDEQNYFIKGLTKGDGHDFPQAWIGGFDAIYPGYWMWSDGSKFNYDNWYHDDYSAHDGYHCLKMNYHLKLEWYPDYCNSTLGFVCCKQI
ncbi:galactose-specific lectin nattectin [Amphiprion ocellaris]|nr:galactose-specific lectin nattectin [Amphiprion ocellaris]